MNAPEPLRSPVSGVISATGAVAGQVVEAKEILFEVVDPARLSVEALAYDPALVEGIASASALVPGGVLELEFVGGGRQLREQALPLLFRVKAQNAPVAVGQALKVIARTARKTKGAGVPQASLVKNGAGETVVWAHAGAERFTPRKVRFHSLDASTVAVTSGIQNGERIVTEGAGLLAQMR
ncbi:MAG: HlyD family secretion protein [Betaproteobacteria bacterium]|nr:MAG: HlyD family secretion protein [Betaproteobacteria bacterium]